MRSVLRTNLPEAGAEKVFGRKFIEGRIRLRQRMLGGGAARTADAVVQEGSVGASLEHAGQVEMESMLLSALANMGFRRGESKKAVAGLAWRAGDRVEGTARFVLLLRPALSVLVR